MGGTLALSLAADAAGDCTDGISGGTGGMEFPPADMEGIGGGEDGCPLLEAVSEFGMGGGTFIFMLTH